MIKEILKEKAINLRRQGKTYSEIMKEIPVAKSTLSLWLRGVGLSVVQKQVLTEKKRVAQLKGAEAQKRNRIKRQLDIINHAKSEIGHMTERELWLIGIALYWAEGSKEKESYPGTRVSFSNSDPQMILLFLKWLKICVKVSRDDISADLYIHESHRSNINIVIDKWSEILSVPKSFFKAVYYKKNKINTKRKNTGALYLGLLRVNMRASSELNRRITGWIVGINKYWGIV